MKNKINTLIEFDSVICASNLIGKIEYIWNSK